MVLVFSNSFGVEVVLAKNGLNEMHKMRVWCFKHHTCQSLKGENRSSCKELKQTSCYRNSNSSRTDMKDTIKHESHRGCMMAQKPLVPYMITFRNDFWQLIVLEFYPSTNRRRELLACGIYTTGSSRYW